MKQSLSWIDPEDLRPVLGDLSVSVAPSPLGDLLHPPPDLAHGVAEPRQPAAPPPDVKLFEPPAGSIQERMTALVEWVGDQLGSDQVFLADQEGLALAGRNADQELVAVSSWLMTAWEKAQRFLGSKGGGAGVFELVGGNSLLLVVARAPWGLCGLGVVVRAIPDRAAVGRAKVALRAVVSEGQAA
jgi:hypothetical protein